ncbi:unnamed protein product [Brassica oleracea var. botrytis]
MLKGSCCVQEVLKDRERRRCFGFTSQVAIGFCCC